MTETQPWQPVDCPDCYGVGAHYEPCVDCDGTGEPADPDVDDCCAGCYGDGTVYVADCVKCDGDGFWLEPVRTSPTNPKGNP